MQGEWFFVHLEEEMLHTSAVRSLFIDLASHDGLLACVDEKSVLASQAVDRRIGDHELLPLFERVVQAAGWKPTDLTQIACVVGPGGFMSLRVAAAFANTLMHELKIPGGGLHLSDVYAARARNTDRGQGPSETFLWMHSTKKHELFIRGFGELKGLWPQAAHVRVEDCLKDVPAGASWVGELLPEHEALFGEKLQRRSLRPLVDILPGFLREQTFAERFLEPWYGRGY